MENPIVINSDYSNPQQGPIAPPFKMANNESSKKAFKVPPTRRDDRKIFVGGLPSNVTDEEFNEFFSQFGTVVDSVVMFDRETRRSRGFGFVTYENPNVVRLLLEMKVDGTDGFGRVQMRGKVCEIKAAEPKESSTYNGGKGRRGGGSSSSNNRGYRAYPQPGYPSNGEAYPQQQGYPPATNSDGPVPVNQGVPRTLPMPNGHHMMYPHYAMGAYYPPPAAMPAAYSHYGYAHDGLAQYYDQGAMEAYAMSSAMTAAAPGPHAQLNDGYALYGNAFVPVEEQTAVPPRQEESPPGTSSMEEAKQT